MTHPDILKMERFGELYPTESARQVGFCLYCGQILFEDSPELTFSQDGSFCDMDCCHGYYEIRQSAD